MQEDDKRKSLDAKANPSISVNDLTRSKQGSGVNRIYDRREMDIFFNDNFLSSPSSTKNVHWSIPWADLMMTMFVLFLVMFIYRAADREFVFDHGPGGKEGKVLQNEIHHELKNKIPGGVETTAEDSLSEIYDKTQQMINANDLKDMASVELQPDKAVRITLTSDLLFDKGKAELKSKAKLLLKDVAQRIRGQHNIINVVGHTDNDKISSFLYPTNWELSAIRACRVARFLIEDMGLDEKRFFISAHSYNMPKRPNTTPENKAINRRVEIILMKEKPYASIDELENFAD